MNKTRLALVLGTATALVLHLAGASAQQPKASEPKSYANDISNVPCSAFRNNGNGSWTEIASPANRLVFQGSVYSGGMAKRLEKRCGAKRG